MGNAGKNMGVTVKFWNRDPRVPLVRLTGMISPVHTALISVL